MTEMLFNGIFNDMTVSQCVSLLSCFVINENIKEETPKLTQELSTSFKIIQVYSVIKFTIFIMRKVIVIIN